MGRAPDEHPHEPGVFSWLAPIRLANAVAVAGGQLRRHPLKSFLILQGVIWGTALAVFAPATIHGSRSNAVANWRRYHLDRIVATPDASSNLDHFEESDPLAISEALGPARLLVISSMNVVPARLADGTSVDVLGVRPGLDDARDFHVEQGRYLTAADCDQKRAVCVLEREIATALFGSDSPLGRMVELTWEDQSSQRLEVVGLTEQRHEERLSMDALGMTGERNQEVRDLLREATGILRFPGEWERNDRAIHLPYTLVPGSTAGPTWIYMRVRELELVTESADLVAEILVSLGRAPQLFFDSGLPILLGDQLDIFLKLDRVISSCCIAMGVIVVVIILLIGVLSRYEEIGIRMVEGATRADIGVQFLVEAGMTGLVGAILGIPAAYLLGEIWLSLELSQMAAFSPPLPATLRTIGLVVVTSLVAGALPAWRASRLDPVRVLRHE